MVPTITILTNIQRDLDSIHQEVRQLNASALGIPQGQTLFTRLRCLAFRIQRSRGEESLATSGRRADLAQQLLHIRLTLVLRLSTNMALCPWLAAFLEAEATTQPITDSNNWAAYILLTQRATLHPRLFPHLPIGAPLTAINNPQDPWWGVGLVTCLHPH